MTKLATFAIAGLALGVLLAVSLGVTVTILLMIFNQEMEMRDPVWFKEFEREYNEREDRLDEIREKTKEFKEQLEKTNSLWRKRKNLEKENG